MFGRILPSTVENRFPGHQAGVWLFWAITLVTVGRSLVHLFSADGGAQSIATVPLSSFSGEGAAAVVSIFGLWGLSQLLLGIVFVVVGLLYRALIPLMYVLIVAEYAGRIGVTMMKPLPTLGTPPGAYANLVLIPLAIVGLGISLWTSRSDGGTS